MGPLKIHQITIKCGLWTEQSLNSLALSVCHPRFFADYLPLLPLVFSWVEKVARLIIFVMSVLCICSTSHSNTAVQYVGSSKLRYCTRRPLLHTGRWRKYIQNVNEWINRATNSGQFNWRRRCLNINADYFDMQMGYAQVNARFGSAVFRVGVYLLDSGENDNSH